jgi:hypothetical protein
MKRHAIAACVLATALTASAVAQAQLAESRFTTDADGWVNVMLPYPSAVPPTILNTYAPTWISGYIKLADPDGSGSVGNTQYWQAPAKFLGDQLDAYGDSLTFDLANGGSGFGTFHQEDIILVGGGITLVHDLGSVPAPAFTHCGTLLTESAWRRDGLAGPVPTQAEFITVLGSLTQLFIRAEYQLGPDTQFLDNVVLVNASTGVGADMAGRPFELAPLVPNPTTAGARVEFALPRAGEADVAVFDAGGRRIATLAHGAFAPGRNSTAWDGRDGDGQPARAGLYWVRLTVGAEHRTRKLVRLD